MTNELTKQNFAAVLRAARVMPIMTVHDVKQALLTAEAIARGGLTVMEITLRTEVAVKAIRAIRDKVPQITIGAGTLMRSGDFRRAEDAGAQFAVSPGLTDELAEDALASTMPFLPGVQTATEAMRAVEFGFRELKFYPAKAAGGLDVLSDFSSIFRGVGWCPTGKVARDDVAAYLALPSVLCCGGSWVAPQDLQSREDWAGVEANARSVAGIKVSPRSAAGIKVSLR